MESSSIKIMPTRATRATRSLLLAALMTLSCASLIAGCGKKAETSDSSSGGSKVVAPMAKPGAVIGTNNPPAGQPNHMTPEMQAQLQRYQSYAPGAKK